MYKPIIIIGAPRSGTKFLRSLIGAHPYISEIPYDVGYVWRYGNESVSHDELTPSMLNEKIKKYIIKTLPTLIKNKSADPVLTEFFVEKSVPNTLRVEFISSVYPDAKFIHLIRDGRAATESSIRMWKLPPERGYLLKKIKYFPWSNYKYAIWYIVNIIKGKLSSKRGQIVWGPRYKNIENDLEKLPLETVCARQWKQCVTLAQQQISSLPSIQVLEIRYEALVQSESTIHEICDFLELSSCNAIIDKFQKTIKHGNINKWKDNLSSKQMRLVESEISSTLSELGYNK